MRKAVETFFKAWGMTNADARSAAISDVFTDTGTYADPRSGALLSGFEAITAYVSMFSENAPGWEANIVATSETEGVMRATVAFGGKGPDGSEMVQHGQYIVDFNGEKISRMIGFVGLGEPK